MSTAVGVLSSTGAAGVTTVSVLVTLPESTTVGSLPVAVSEVVV